MSHDYILDKGPGLATHIKSKTSKRKEERGDASEGEGRKTIGKPPKPRCLKISYLKRTLAGRRGRPSCGR